MNISINNFRNIKDLNFSIENNKLTLIHGQNGIGKSSIALALESNPDNINEYRSFYPWGDPLVVKDDNYQYKLFNENFINFNLKDDSSPLNNTYELIFKDEGILRLEEKIKLVKEKISILLKSEDFIKYKSEIDNITKGLNISNNDDLKNTVYLKAIKSKLPDSLTKSNTNMKLIFNHQSDQVAYSSWKLSGSNYEYLNYCPYCSQIMNKKSIEINDDFKQNVNKNHIKNKIELQNAFNIVSEVLFLRSDQIISIINGKYDINSKTNLDIMKIAIRKINKFDDIIKQVTSTGLLFHNNEYYKINYDRSIFNTKNQFVVNLLDIIDEFNKKILTINIMRKAIVRNIEKKIVQNNEDLNALFKASGLDYNLEFVKEESHNVKVILKHKTANRLIDEIDSTLSYGEKNLIAVILFCLLQRSKTGNVIIFDDPSTLFDNSKRFLFLHLLLSRSNFKLINSKDYVVLLTHDFETFKDFAIMKQERKYVNKIDIILLENNGGICKTKKINPNDFDYYINNIKRCISESQIPIVKLIYFRKLIYIGHIKDTSNKMMNFISSVSKYKVPQTKNGDRFFSSDEIIEIVDAINKQYDIDLKFIFSVENLNESIEIDVVINQLKSNIKWFEKLILFRLLGQYLNVNSIEINNIDPIIMKFVTQSYHVEDDHLYDLIYNDNNPVPKYIFLLIDEILVEIENELKNRSII